MSDTDGSRLKTWRQKKGLSQRDLASLLGRSQGFVGNIESDKTGLSRDLIARMAERTSVNVAWLLTGIGPMDRETSDQDFEPLSGSKRIERPDFARPLTGDFASGGEEYSLIPRFDVDVSAGAGIVPVEGAEAEYLAFSRSWLIRNGISADLCGLVRVKGDSMSPTIPDGALVLVHRPEMIVEKEGIYAFSRDGQAYIKRLAPIGLGESGKMDAMIIMSDNPAYPPETISGPELNEIRIAGRVRSYIVSL